MKGVVVLYEPEIPGNVMAIMRTCACFDVKLILIEPLGFVLKESEMKRIKMDYNPEVEKISCFKLFLERYKDRRKILFSPHSKLNATSFEFYKDDILIFGRESNGVKEEVAALCENIVAIPMSPRCRSLNLSVSVGIGISFFFKNN